MWIFKIAPFLQNSDGLQTAHDEKYKFLMFLFSLLFRKQENLVIELLCNLKQSNFSTTANGSGRLVQQLDKWLASVSYLFCKLIYYVPSKLCNKMIISILQDKTKIQFGVKFLIETVFHVCLMWRRQTCVSHCFFSGVGWGHLERNPAAQLFLSSISGVYCCVERRKGLFIQGILLSLSSFHQHDL